jgi:DNA-binding transcriptional MerR regulator
MREFLANTRSDTMAESTTRTEIACSLSDDEYRVRRALVRESLLPHIDQLTRFESNLRLRFSEGESLRESVETFVSLERQCCGFLTFRVSPPGEALTLTIEGPPEAQATPEKFAEALRVDPDA